jgi:hypothetical protein
MRNDSVTEITIRPRVSYQTQVWKAVFIRVLKKVMNVSVACEIIGVSRANVYTWRKDDTTFAEQWDDAIALAQGSLESSVYLKVAQILQDDRKRLAMPEAKMIELLLAGAMPEKYRQRVIEIDNSTNVSNLTIDWATVPQAIFDAFQRNELTLEDVYQQTLLLNAQQKAPSSNEGA